MNYPENDTEFKDQVIESVSQFGDGTYSITCDGWTLCCGSECPVKPEVKQTARYYGKGNTVRGLFIEGVKIWYRTEEEEKEHREIQLYGANAYDWLDRWDKGQSCWTIEMGGIGPGYEQCIHIVCAEVLRWFIANNLDSTRCDDNAYWKIEREKMEAELFQVEAIKELGLSGAQWGAGMNLAIRMYIDGPRKVMTDDRVKDRHIQVGKFFPGARKQA